MMTDARIMELLVKVESCARDRHEVNSNRLTWAFVQIIVLAIVVGYIATRLP